VRVLVRVLDLEACSPVGLTGIAVGDTVRSVGVAV
jgi:hypothetical protein